MTKHKIELVKLHYPPGQAARDQYDRSMQLQFKLSTIESTIAVLRRKPFEVQNLESESKCPLGHALRALIALRDKYKMLIERQND